MLDKIPEDFIQRQMKETQYISIKVKEELGKIVGTERVKTTTGAVTDYLRQHWGLNDKFKKITRERFETMAKIVGNENLVRDEFDEKRNKYVLKNDLWSKRYDHRHHAIDALVVACTEQSHIQRLNNLNKDLQSFFAELDLFPKEKKVEGFENFTGNEKEPLIAFSKLDKEKREDISKQVFDSLYQKEKSKDKTSGNSEILFATYLSLEKEAQEKIQETMPSFRYFEKPWEDFYKDHAIEKQIESIIISHKPNKKLLIQKQKDTKGNVKDVLRIKGKLHEETLIGTVDGKPAYRIKLSSLASSQNTESSVKGKVERIVSPALRQQIMHHFVHTCKGNHTKAFSADGIADLNKNRKYPVYAVKIFMFKKDETASDKLKQLTRDKYNEKLFVNTGSNYCFAVAENNGKRKFGVLAFFDAAKLIKHKMKAGNKNIDEAVKKYFEEDCEKTKGSKLLFTLANNDMVYLPGADEKNIPMNKDVAGFEEFWKNVNRKNIYKVVKMDSEYCYFIPHTTATEIKYSVPKTDTTDSNEENTENENQSEQAIDKKATQFKEYGKYQGCSPFVLDSKKVESLKGKQEKSKNKKNILKEIDNILLELKSNEPANETKQGELMEQLKETVINNLELNPIKEIKKRNAELADAIQSSIKETKEKEINNLIDEIKNNESNEKQDELVNNIADILIEYKDFALKNFLKKKDKLIAKKISAMEKSGYKKKEKYKEIAIQDTCIKVQVDRLGNILPA